ncbi:MULTISPECIES: antibiotic biosynthesis monooxygenase family protein [unclassified Frankia]|uniref:putative quinol monooxygenase n=1 Tax=unclassified Frankia TaxID=2632575 RepID=UPI002AD33708|nr:MULTISPECIES: antibiotic biosynthesis monooxygenase family protein [unclassified Frankia]
MATLLVHIRVRPGAEERFEQIASELHAATHSREHDVRRYEYWRGEEPGTYYTLESFDRFAGFLAHETSPHHEEARPALRDVLEAVRLEWVDPIGGASPLTPTDMPPPQPDATELERALSERLAAQVQDWWLPLRTSDVASRGGGPAQ